MAVNEPDELAKCSITITIFKVGQRYNYRFKSDSRVLEGKVSLEANENKDGFYITLEGIEWSEYEGELVIDEDGSSSSKEELKIPVGIQGLIKANEIFIQNYGNSMNSYVQLGECGKKYIVLKRQLAAVLESVPSTAIQEEFKDDREMVTQNECFEKSTFELPYTRKSLPSKSDYRIVKCDVEGTEEFLCDRPMLRYIPLPDYKDVKIVLVPMDCGDFSHRLLLLTFVNKKLVANQYMEGEWFEPGAEQKKELTSFAIDKDYKITVTTISVNDGHTALKDKTNFQLLPDGKLKKT
ncbi:MAG: hypothetical protein WKF66_13255 [Pedobacter sp.]